jgi:AhpD family alkylhydroperoxidase
MVKRRLNYANASPGAYSAIMGIQNYVRECGLELSLLELVKVRASQLNKCAYCIDMHTKDARLNGETEQRLYALTAWDETPFFTERERAALEWTEILTFISEEDVPDEVYDDMLVHFSEKELVDLSLAIILINGWNRLAIPFRDVPGSYEPKES